MIQKFIYLLEHCIIGRSTNIGVFTSRKKAEDFLKKLPKKHQYIIYKLPTNCNLTQGKKLKDQQGLFDHWHYGTFEMEYEEYDDNDNLIQKGTRIQVEWPS